MDFSQLRTICSGEIGRFAEQAVATAVNNGVPVPHVSIYPGAFATHTCDELLENTRNVL